MSANTGKHGDRIRDTASAVSGSTVSLNNAAPSAFQTFGAFYSNGDICPSYLLTDAGSNWEVSYGAYSANTLARAATPIASSNAGAQVASFTGTVQVACVDPALSVDADVTGIAAGYLYANAYTSGTVTTVSPAVGTVIYMPVVINQWFSSVNIHVNISTLFAGTSTFALGFYSNLNAQPNTRLGQTTGLNGGSGGAVGDNNSGSLALVPQRPGLYWVGYVCATNAPALLGPGAQSGSSKIISGIASIAAASFQSPPVGWSQSNATLPATAGSLSLMTSGIAMVGVAATL